MPRTPQINRLVNLRKRLESEYNNKLYVDTLKIKKTKNRLTHVDLFSVAFNIAKIGFGMRHILLYDPSLFLLLLKLTLKLSAFFAHRVMRVIRQLLI